MARSLAVLRHVARTTKKTTRALIALDVIVYKLTRIRYYAGLGAVGDFSDALLLFAFTRQVSHDLTNQPYYFECLENIAIGRKSDILGTEVAMLASNGVTSKRNLDNAYRYFGIDSNHAGVIGDDHIIGTFKARLDDISPSQVEEARHQLRILAAARSSERIKAAADDVVDTEEQALAFLNLETGATDDFIQTMYTVKVGAQGLSRPRIQVTSHAAIIDIVQVQDSPEVVETARKAVSVIAESRQSQSLRDFLEKGIVSTPEMDVGEAYALFQIDNRAIPIDLDVLKTTVDLADPGDVEKLQKAFAIVQQDQAQTHNNRMDTADRPEARRNSYPLESWPVGLRNIGNTCYLNSVLQFLFTIKPLREFILNSDKYMQDPSQDALKDKKVGRVAITAERVIVAQKCKSIYTEPSLLLY